MAKTGCWRSGWERNAVGEAPARPNGTDAIRFTNSIAVKLLAKGTALRQQHGEGPS
jgi:hypothetical protein